MAAHAHYRIGEFSSLSGVTTKALRFYDEIGLFRPASVDARTGYRLYRPRQLADLASILALKDLGASLHDVRDLLRSAGAQKDRREVLSALKRSIERSIHTAAQSLKFVNAALNELDQPDKARRPLPVVVKRRPATPVASVRAKVAHYDDILHFERELLRDLPPQSIGSLRGVLWHSCADSGTLEGEPFVALKRQVPSRTFYDVKDLPAATVASTYCNSDDDSAEQGYRALQKWLTVADYQLAGPKREIYLHQMLEIQFPLKSA
jgi:DNA-binding transcriptional MerR regulator